MAKSKGQGASKWSQAVSAVFVGLAVLILIIGSGNLEPFLETIGWYWWAAKELPRFFGEMLLGGVVVVGLIAALGLFLQWLGKLLP